MTCSFLSLLQPNLLDKEKKKPFKTEQENFELLLPGTKKGKVKTCARSPLFPNLLTSVQIKPQ